MFHVTRLQFLVQVSAALREEIRDCVKIHMSAINKGNNCLKIPVAYILYFPQLRIQA